MNVRGVYIENNAVVLKQLHNFMCIQKIIVNVLERNNHQINLLTFISEAMSGAQFKNRMNFPFCKTEII